jgi:hypothetical protein
MNSFPGKINSFLLALFAANFFISLLGGAQTASDLYRINKGVTQSQTDFHQISVPEGGEQILVDLEGSVTDSRRC